MSTDKVICCQCARCINKPNNTNDGCIITWYRCHPPYTTGTFYFCNDCYEYIEYTRHMDDEDLTCLPQARDDVYDIDDIE